jgi:hypothetical protein
MIKQGRKMKDIRKKIGLLALSLLVLMPGVSMAKKAELILIPTRIILDQKDRYASLTIKNSGDATGQFKIDVVDMIMEEEGNVREIKSGEKPQFSAKDMIKISPRSVSVKAFQSQNIRVLIRKPSDLEDGEYRAHVRVKMVNDNAEESEDLEQDEAKIEVRANIVVVIPIIIRQGEVSFTSSITDAKLVNENGQNQVSLYLHNEGNRSSMGDLRVVQVLDGEKKILSVLQGVPVYRGVEKRRVLMSLDTEEEIDFSKGKLMIQYFAQEKEGGNLLTESEIKR